MSQRPGQSSAKNTAANVLIIVVVGLVLTKAGVAWLTGSISIIAQATDSLIDLFAGIITFSAVRYAGRPADAEHPYGHGKIENIGGVVQGVLIFIAASLIIYASVNRIVSGAVVEIPLAGVGVMAFSILVSVSLSRYLFRAARDTDSVVLEANAHNIAADVYSASAVLVGLLIVAITGIAFIDSILAIAVALYIFTISFRALSASGRGLLDTRIAHEEEQLIMACVERHKEQVAGLHYLRTRRAGSQRYIDFHIVMNKDITLDESHRIIDRIESEIRERLPEASVTIHAEPCDRSCERCAAECEAREREWRARNR
ncbi:MAG: cation transporter [Dehalococcoidia bacterium]|nr:cation transporter [Dehalococcoidia bacterium]